GSVCIGHHGLHGIAGLQKRETSPYILRCLKYVIRLLTSRIKYDNFFQPVMIVDCEFGLFVGDSRYYYSKLLF
ncbi:MAG: hypothetical protein ACUZ9M_04705, partial [Candidatus Scalindua sp.]